MILNCPYAAQWKTEIQKCNSKEVQKEICHKLKEVKLYLQISVCGVRGGISGEKYVNS